MESHPSGHCSPNLSGMPDNLRYPEKCFIPKVDEKLVSSKDQSVFSRDNTNGTTESSSGSDDTSHGVSQTNTKVLGRITLTRMNWR